MVLPQRLEMNGDCGPQDDASNGDRAERSRLERCRIAPERESGTINNHADTMRKRISAMTKYDLLWVALKILGVYFFVTGLMNLSSAYYLNKLPTPTTVSYEPFHRQIVQGPVDSVWRQAVNLSLTYAIIQTISGIVLIWGAKYFVRLARRRPNATSQSKFRNPFVSESDEPVLEELDEKTAVNIIN
jgi:hypothetical protein